MRSIRTQHIVAFTALAFMTAACGGDDTADTAEFGEVPELTTPADTPMMGTADDADGMVSSDFVELGGSGVSGSVILEGDGAATRVTVMLMGAGEGVHQGHIHMGTCDNPGGAHAALEPVTTDASGMGEATSTVEMPLSGLRDGQHVVMYHEAGGSPGASVACAPIPAA